MSASSEKETECPPLPSQYGIHWDSTLVTSCEGPVVECGSLKQRRLFFACLFMVDGSMIQ